MAPTARLEGTWHHPVFTLSFHPWSKHPDGEGKTLLDWVKALPSRYFDAETKTWIVDGLGNDPAGELAGAGFDVDMGDFGDTDLNELVTPVARVSSVDPSNVLVRPRLLGYEQTSKLLGPGATWDKTRRRFEIPATDMVNADGRVRPGILLSPSEAQHCASLHTGPLIDLSRVAELTALASSTQAAEGTDFEDVPDWFGLALYGYQHSGAVAAAAGRRLVADQPGLGKSQPLTAPIPTPTGWTTIGDIEVGDDVLGRDGRPTKVLGLSAVHEKPVYEVHLSDGQIIEASPDHEWLVSTRNTRRAEGADRGPGDRMRADIAARVSRLRELARTAPVVAGVTAGQLAQTSGFSESYVYTTLKGANIPFEAQERQLPLTNRPGTRTAKVRLFPADESLMAIAARHELSIADGGLRARASLERIVTTQEMARAVHPKGEPHAHNWAIRLTSPLDLPEADLPVDPYVLGAWLGDGHANSGEFTASSRPGEDGQADQAHLIAQLRSAGIPARQTTEDPNRVGAAGLRPLLRKAGVLTDKHIPITYLRASQAQRLALLQGLMDTDGSAHRGGWCELGSSNERLARDALELIRSLGIKATIRTYPHTYVYNGLRKPAKDRHRITFTTTTPVFRLPRKAALLPTATRDTQQWLYVTDIKVREPEPMRCLLVDHPEHLYLTGHFVPTHNTRSALAAAAIVDPERVLVVTPPVALTQWQREATASQVTAPGRHSNTVVVGASDEVVAGDHVVVIDPRRKMPPIPEAGVLVVSDSLLTSRKALADLIVAWQPQVLIVDEVHRAKTWTSARTKAIKRVAAATTGPRFAISGTPMFAQPAELAAPLAITGQLEAVFGSYGAFLERYCREDNFGRQVARVRALPELREKLRTQVWVRRRKTDVLKDLPDKTRSALFVDVDLAGFRATHAEVIEAIEEWVDDQTGPDGSLPGMEEVEAFSRDSIRLVSQLRMAAGLAKVEAAADIIATWLEQNPASADGTWDRPLIVWTHHKVVTRAMAEAVEPFGGAEIIDGSTSQTERTRIVTDFQAGRTPVLVASITAAGVGITLTRSSDVYFIETDWTPALVTQAEDRCHRISQDRSVTITTLIAPGTLDETVQRTLKKKARNLEAVMGDSDQDVAVAAEGASPAAAIVKDMVLQVLDRRRRQRKKTTTTIRRAA